MNLFQFNPMDGAICSVCGKNDVKDATLICIDGTYEGKNCKAIQVHHECLVEGLLLYPGEKGSVIGKAAPYYTTEEVDIEEEN